MEKILEEKLDITFVKQNVLRAFNDAFQMQEIAEVN
jgi:hypothetical protein